MNKILLFIVGATLIACNTTPKNYVSISGKLENASSKTITVQNRDYQKEIAIKADGTFSDTLHLTEGTENYVQNFYTITTEKGRMYSYLKNGFELAIAADEADFSNTLKVSGEGSENTMYILERIKASESLNKLEELFTLEEDAFIVQVEKIKNTFDEIVKKHSSIAKDLYEGELKGNEELYTNLLKSYEQQNHVAANTAKGAPSPKFVNYENYKGGTTSLDDLKGKYVYIDVWATWCGPCRQQIPFLQELEKKYHGKNIEFVSISTDNPNKHEAWKQMIAEKQMGGIQLFAGNDQSFSMDYQITGIPRFILVDPQGNIVDANAPRPSDQRLVELFNSLKI
ncbi:TlpA family protein disulfide reductase [Flavicella sediminum]|uniref:TlpA family protein disulfide reductase n=1 Tax=Flavicella sediminum TaxID=2585141 RepID=UPI00111F7440|nr:TlpA disulfide reductase family protein [Flavicella sediminum]